MLTQNNIQQLRHDTFPHDFYKLKYLYIDRNQLEIIHHQSFLLLTNLKGLYLQRNFLTTNSMCITVQHNLTSLTTLKPGSNVIRVIPYGCFNQLSSLKHFHLQNKFISHIDDNALSKNQKHLLQCQNCGHYTYKKMI